MRGNLLVIPLILLSLILLTAMSARVAEQQQTIVSITLNLYNEMNFHAVVSNYFALKQNGYISILPPEVIYAFANSLYKTSNYAELLNFTNYYIQDAFLSNNISLLIGFASSELGYFEVSDSIIKQSISKPHLRYYTDLINYYRFRNSIFLGKESILQVKPNLLKEDDISRILSILPTSSDEFSILISSFLNTLKKTRNAERIAKALSEKKYSYRSSIISVSKNLISAGFASEGAKLILSTELPNVVRDYYNALLLVESKNFTDAKKIIERLIKNYETNKNILKSYNILLDKILILNLRLYSNRDSKEFNDNAIKYLNVGGVEYLSYVLRNYKLLSPRNHLEFVKNFYSRVELNDQTKPPLSAFISHQLHEGNIQEIRDFVAFMLKVTKDSSWEKEILLLDFLTTQNYDRKVEVMKEILIKHPFTYEYIVLSELLATNSTLLSNVVILISGEASNIVSRYKNKPRIEDLNSIIGLKFLEEMFGTSFGIDIDIKKEVETFKKRLLLSYDTQNTNTNNNTNENINTLPEYLSELFSKNLIIDTHLEIKHLTPRPHIKYVREFKKFNISEYVVRAYERFGFQNDNIYFRRAFFIMAFLEELYPTPYADRVNNYCSKYGVENDLVYAIMRQESRFSPFVVSVANAMGLMQLILPTADATAKRFLRTTRSITPLEVFSIDLNLHLGISHIRELLDFSKKQPENFRDVFVISSYNAGMTAVRKWIDSLKTSDPILFVEGIRFHETREYTKIVLENKFVYKNFVLKSSKFPEIRN